jgi:8-hydroxy-5-deazaflavin:NADPH oxidoreductase
MKTIGILGSAIVGQTLARGFKSHGYEVRIGSRTASKLADFSASTGIASGTFADVAKWGDILVLAVKGSAAADVLAQAGGEHLAGKIIIDTTNPIADAPPVDGVQFFTGPNESLLERLQNAYPRARFVKGFNSVGNKRMVKSGLRARDADDVLLRERRRGEVHGGGDPATVRMGTRRHGHGRWRACHRAALSVVVHSRYP